MPKDMSSDSDEFKCTSVSCFIFFLKYEDLWVFYSETDDKWIHVTLLKVIHLSCECLYIISFGY